MAHGVEKINNLNYQSKFAFIAKIQFPVYAGYTLWGNKNFTLVISAITRLNYVLLPTKTCSKNSIIIPQLS